MKHLATIFSPPRHSRGPLQGYVEALELYRVCNSLIWTNSLHPHNSRIPISIVHMRTPKLRRSKWLVQSQRARNEWKHHSDLVPQILSAFHITTNGCAVFLSLSPTIRAIFTFLIHSTLQGLITGITLTTVSNVGLQGSQAHLHLSCQDVSHQAST